LEHKAPGCAETLMPLVYSELRRVAGHYLSRPEKQGHTLAAQPALVHELPCALVTQKFPGRAARTSLACVANDRRILVDHARRQSVCKTAGGALTLELLKPASPIGASSIYWPWSECAAEPGQNWMNVNPTGGRRFFAVVCPFLKPSEVLVCGAHR